MTVKSYCDYSGIRRKGDKLIKLMKSLIMRAKILQNT